MSDDFEIGDASRRAADVVTAGQTWRCDESRADPDDVPAPHDVPLWAPHPRFTAIVDRVEDDYVELTVTTGNSHPRTPEFGAEMVSTVETLTSGNRWTLESDASSGQPVGDRGGPMTDDDNNHANAVAAQLRLAEENGTLPEDMDVDADEEDDRESDDGE